MDMVGLGTGHQADGSGYQYNKSGARIGEDVTRMSLIRKRCPEIVV